MKWTEVENGREELRTLRIVGLVSKFELAISVLFKLNDGNNVETSRTLMMVGQLQDIETMVKVDGRKKGHKALQDPKKQNKYTK